MNWPLLSVDPLSPHQLERVTIATQKHLGILAGSPGTGKTFTVAQVAMQLGQTVGYDQIACAAPTGKAAVRLTEALSAMGLPLRARTIHSLLGVVSADGGWSFAHNRANPLPYKVIFLDEASMIDTDLAASFFAARARDCLVLVVGDVNQLPPVGHGAPLRDMIAAGVPCGELTEIKRQKSNGQIHAVVQACADMRDGMRFVCERELVNVAAFAPSIQVDEMFDALAAATATLKLDPVWDCQVLCAVNKKSDLSRKELNKAMQSQLNPNDAVYGSPFRLADKVVNTKNGWYPLVESDETPDPNLQLNDDAKCYVANGELGEVTRVEANYMHVRLTSPKRLIVVPRGQADEGDEDEEGASGTGCNWDLGYALSVHKSQGSEWPIVIVMLDDSSGAKRVCDRAWLYTAISRAKQRCYLIGDIAVAHGFCRRQNINKRKTFLKQKIQEGLKPL